MPVGELLGRISSREITEWMIFDRHEPIGDARMDVLFALLDSILANVNRNQGVKPEPFSVADFMPDWWPEPTASRVQAVEAQPPKVDPALKRMSANLAMAELITGALGGKDLRKR